MLGNHCKIFSRKNLQSVDLQFLDYFFENIKFDYKKMAVRNFEQPLRL